MGAGGWPRAPLALVQRPICAPPPSPPSQILAIPLPGADSHLFTVSRVTAELVARGHDVLLAVSESDVATLRRAAPNAGRVVVYPAAYSKQVSEEWGWTDGSRSGAGKTGDGGAREGSQESVARPILCFFAIAPAPLGPRLGTARLLSTLVA